MTTISSQTLHLAASDSGTGEPALLFVPGWCGDRSVFDGVAERASRHRRVVTVDLPDHGASPALDEVTLSVVVDGLINAIESHNLQRLIPVTLSHAGWAAVELRSRLGDGVIPAVVLLDWMVLGTPPGFADALAGLQSPAWAEVRSGLVSMWTDGLDIPQLHTYVDSMCRYTARHWQRAGREIASSFAANPIPLDALDALQPCPTLHLYSQPGDDAVLEAQCDYARTHRWFHVERLNARSHFPMFEAPDAMVEQLEAFIGQLS